MKKLATLALVMFVFSCVGSYAYADEAAKAAEAKQGETAEHVTRSEISTGTGMAAGGACVGAGLAAIGGGYAIARVGGNCIESMARQPEAAGSMFAPMIVTAAMIEGAMLFAIVVCLLAVLKSF